MSQFDSSVQTRLRVLSDLESTVAHLARTVPRSAELQFDTRPTSLTDPAPEPNSSKFLGYYRWLTEQRRYVSEDLLPLGDGDVDRRREVLERRFEAEIKRLDDMKEKAWSKYAVDVHIRARLGMADGAGPQIIAAGNVRLCTVSQR